MSKSNSKASLSTPINLRISENKKQVIDQAAELAGKNRTDFMIDAAYREAKNLLLDRRLFSVDNKVYQKFVEMLDSTPGDLSSLKKLMKKKAPWD